MHCLRSGLPAAEQQDIGSTLKAPERRCGCLAATKRFQIAVKDPVSKTRGNVGVRQISRSCSRIRPALPRNDGETTWLASAKFRRGAKKGHGGLIPDRSRNASINVDVHLCKGYDHLHCSCGMGVKGKGGDKAAGYKGKKAGASGKHKDHGWPSWYLDGLKGSLKDRQERFQKLLKGFNEQDGAPWNSSAIYYLTKIAISIGVDVLSAPKCPTRAYAKARDLQRQ